jgi:predicted metal-dependent phosphoesterase TrpH
MTLWNVDLHSHTKWSKDCLTEFEEIINLAKKRGIDRIAITDHNTAGGAIAMQKIAPELVIVGEEIMTNQGEILAYYVRESIPAGLSPMETIQRLRDQGAVISVSHPFDRLRKGAWEEDQLLQIMEHVDAIEIYNARCIFPVDNDKALKFAQEHHLCGTAGSDAHTRIEYGRAMTCLRPFNNADEMRAAIRDAEYIKRLSSPHVHIGSSVAKRYKKWGWRKRMWEGG